MFSRFQTSYQRVEAGVQRLTDSIAAYNPSTTAAEELLAADEAVNEDLEQLIIHQQNHLRIAELRHTAASLDEATKTTIRLLAGLRKEIQAIPSLPAAPSDASSLSSQARSAVRVDELLSYARFISKTTVSPTISRTLPSSSSTQQQHSQQQPSLTASQVDPTGNVVSVDVHMTNGIATPPPGTQDGSTDNQQTGNTTAQAQNIGIKTLEERDRAWLNPATLPFEPWPSQDKIQSGALADIQRMRERGEDPATVRTAKERELVEARTREQEERERQEQEERMAKYDLGSGGVGARRTGVVNDVPFNPDDL